MRTAFALILMLVLALVSGCATAPNTAAGKEALDAECRDALNRFERVKGLGEFFATSSAYAVFPGVGKGGIIVGGAYGDGQFYEGSAMVGYCGLSQATVGLQIGAQKYRELIFFRDADAAKEFREGSFEFSAQASAVAVEAGASTTADYQNGVLVFTMSTAGLMLEASVGGQKFNYVPK